MQNGLIGLMVVEVRKKIFSRIKKAKYHSAIIDCTPDVSHQEQMGLVIRYIDVDDGIVSIKE